MTQNSPVLMRGHTLAALFICCFSVAALADAPVPDHLSKKKTTGIPAPSFLSLQQTVNGKVTDSKGTPLPGVSVVLKGTSTGTSTDAAGNYTIYLPESSGILVFSYMGFKSQEVAVNGRSKIDLQLEEDTKALSEVVVVSYGTQKKREITGSIVSLNAKQLEDQPVGQFAQKLQGRFAGVQINQVSGTPGGGMSFRIRGAASVSAGNNPLFVVDGFPLVGDINKINPDEIESFTVLKDASASSLYGSRAANGVVLITTKRAKPGKTQVQLNASYGIQQIPKRGRPDLMDAQEFAQFQKEIFEDKAKYEGYTGGIPTIYQNPEQYAGKSTDWYDAVLNKNAPTSNYSLSISTGTDKVSSAIVGGYFKQTGPLLNTRYERYSLRANNEFKVNDFIKIGLNVAPSHSISQNFNTDGAQQILYALFTTPPIFSPDDTDANGRRKLNFSGPGLLTQPNWYRVLTERTNLFKTTALLANTYAEIKFLKDFQFKTVVSLDLEGRNHRVFNPSTTGSGNIFAPPPQLATAQYNTRFYYSYLAENTLNYNKTIADHHHIEALAGYAAQKYREENNVLTGTNFPDDAVSWIDAAATKNGGSSVTEWALLSAIGRLNYNYKGKYLFSAAVRRDGSSRFGADSRWGTFPSVSAGWIVSDEPFAKQWAALSYLKIRGSYGQTGNFNIGNYNQYDNIKVANYIFNNQLVSGRSPGTLGNSKLTWETTSGMDIGLDLNLFNDRIAFTFDYYNKNTTDLLYPIEIPTGTGFPSIVSNVGEFKFWGYEFAISSRNFTGNFRWNTDLNLSINRNKVVQLGTNNTPIGGVSEQGSDSYWKTAIGQPMGMFWGYVFDGIYKTQEEFDKQPKHATSALGTTRMKDLDGNGVINSLDRTYIGNPNPKFIFGINNNFAYKNFDLNIVISGAYGGDILNGEAEWSEVLEGIFNVYKSMKNRWRSPENPGDGIYGRTLTGTTSFPRFTNSRWVSDGSYLTVKNITLGYTPRTFSKLISKCRVYASIQQALVLTSYHGANPEVTSQGLNGFRQGVDASAYPVPRTYSLGLNLNF